MPKVHRDHDKEIEAFKKPVQVVDPMPSLFMGANNNGGYTPETEHLKEVVKQSYSKKDIRLKTDLNARETIIFARADTYQKAFKSKVMKDFMQSIMELKVSNKRLGRKEFVQIAQSFTPQAVPEASPIKRRLFGE